MDTANALETTEQETETTTETLAKAIDLTVSNELAENHIDAVIQFSKRIDDYAKAMDTIQNHIIKRSFAGDWIVHRKPNVQDADQTANMGAAGAERVASFLGITESNWTQGEKIWSEDRKHFAWKYEVDMTFAGRTVHVMSLVGTRDRFFGKKDGQWKPLDEVQEDDIRKAALRAARKEGVRTVTGMRNIPVKKLAALGFDTSLITFVGYEQGKALSAEAKQSKDQTTGLNKRSIKVKAIDFASGTTKDGKPWSRWAVTDTDGVNYSMWGNAESKRASILGQAKHSGEIVEILFAIKSFQNKEQYEIVKVSGIADE